MGSQHHQPVKYSKKALKNSHPFLQQGWIVVEESQRKYLQKSYRTQEKLYEEWKARVSKASAYPSSQFSFLPVDMGYIESEVCSKHGYALVNYPAFPHLLSDQIKRRQGEKSHFQEKELFYLLYVLVAVKADAHKRGETVGDIKPENVFINDDQKVKIGLIHSFPYEASNFSKAKDPQSKSKNVMLAPEDLQSPTLGQLDNSANTQSEVFSIGATILSAGILQDLADLYDYSSWTFSAEKLSAKTLLWLEQQQYSEIFKSIVLNLLSPQPKKRIAVESLQKFLGKYHPFILGKEKFMVVSPPESLEVGVSLIRSKLHH